jgi:hypothetical protein
MQSKVVRLLALALVLSGTSLGLAQRPSQGGGSQSPPPKEEKTQLEAMLAEALKNNPDIRVATASLAAADAELNRTRLQVAQKVITLHAAIASQKAEVAYRQSQFERIKKLGEQKSVEMQVVDEAQQKLTVAKAKLAELEAQLPAVLGKSRETMRQEIVQPHRLSIFLDRNPDIRSVEMMRSREMVGPMAERIRKALQTSVKVNYEDAKFDDILNILSKQVEGLSFRNQFRRESVPESKITLRFEESLPASAILQALSDETGCVFLVRDYGILVVVNNPKNVPPGAMTVEEFLRQKPAEEPRRLPDTGNKPPVK